MSRDFLGSFADSFLKSYLAQQELRQRDEQFRSKQNLDQRQFNLSQAFQEKKFEYEQQQNELAQPKEEAMTKYYESLTNKNNTPEQTNPLLGDRTIGGVKGLAYGFSQNGSEVINKFVPFTRNELNQGEGYNTKTTNDLNNKPIKDPIQQQYETEAITSLNNPETFQIGKDGEEIKLTPQQMKARLEYNMNVLKAAYLDSGTSGWLENLRQQYGRYPNPQEINDEAIQANELSPEQLQKLDLFLEQYAPVYGGVKKTQRDIKDYKE